MVFTYVSDVVAMQWAADNPLYMSVPILTRPSPKQPPLPPFGPSRGKEEEQEEEEAKEVGPDSW